MAAKRRENAGTDRCNITNVQSYSRRKFIYARMYIHFLLDPISLVIFRPRISMRL